MSNKSKGTYTQDGYTGGRSPIPPNIDISKGYQGGPIPPHVTTPTGGTSVMKPQTTSTNQSSSNK